MSNRRRLDVIAIGNAIVDVIADADEDFLKREGMAKGSMQLIDQARAEQLYAKMGPAREASGGSAANTVAGLASLGCSTAFVGQVAPDQLGEIFSHDIRSLGAEFTTPPRDDVGATARCLVLVTSDAQRTMSTFLGAAQELGPEAVDPGRIGDSAILYLEGYLWDPEAARAAMRKAIAAAHSAGTRVAFTLSDAFVVERYREALNQLIDEGGIDILFANQVEAASLTGESDFEASVKALSGRVSTVVVTRSAEGAVAASGATFETIPAVPVQRLVDTTGAGDQFAAGFLAGQARDLGLKRSLELGALCAAEVIQHYGARPETSLRSLAGDLL